VGYQHFRGPSTLHLHFTLKMVAARSFETSVSYCNTTCCYSLENLDLEFAVFFYTANLFQLF